MAFSTRKGSVVIPLAQPYGRFAKTMLEKQVYPDLRRNTSDPPEVPYDVTAQTLGLQMGVDVVPVQDKFDCELESLKPRKPIGVIIGSGNKWYLFPSELLASTKVANTLLRKGVKIWRTQSWVKVGEGELRPGAFVLESGEDTNRLMEEATRLGVRLPRRR